MDETQHLVKGKKITQTNLTEMEKISFQAFWFLLYHHTFVHLIVILSPAACIN